MAPVVVGVRDAADGGWGFECVLCGIGQRHAVLTENRIATAVFTVILLRQALHGFLWLCAQLKASSGPGTYSM